MRLIKHKVSGHQTTVSDAEWQVLVDKKWDAGYKVLEHSPDQPKTGQKKSIAFVPPELQLPAPGAAGAPSISTDSSLPPKAKLSQVEFVNGLLNKQTGWGAIYSAYVTEFGNAEYKNWQALKAAKEKGKLSFDVPA